MESVHFWELSWLAKSEEPVRLSFAKDWPDVAHQSMPMPGEHDRAWLDYFHLGQGIDGFRTRIAFGPGTEARLLPFGQLRGSLDWPILWLTYFAEGSGMLEDRLSGHELPLGPSGACFRHAAAFDEFYKIDTRGPVDQIDLTLRGSALLNLLGEESRDELLAALGLSSVPSTKIRPLPASASELIRALLPENLSGRIRILYSQAKALELLSALISHFRLNRTATTTKFSDMVLPQLREELLQCEGSVPILSELAEKYGRPARQLNDEFKRLYGSTIYAFMINRRLDLAYDMVKFGERPLKVIGAELGYNNVNNFLSAFKRRHGISPGKLRKAADGGATPGSSPAAQEAVDLSEVGVETQ